MKNIQLDGRKMNNEEMVHLYMKMKLNSEEYKGNNLDALEDILTTYDRDVKINIIYSDYLIQNLNEYGEKILKLFLDASKNNDNITVELDGDFEELDKEV